ncbi:MAG: hypothetical protein AB2797_10290, partial [Candidatus Thiodiazotropha sp.]
HAICFEQKLIAKVQIRLDRVLGGLSMKVVVTSKKIDTLYRDELPGYLTMMEERTILSGGEFSRMPKYNDTIEVKSIWVF